PGRRRASGCRSRRVGPSRTARSRPSSHRGTPGPSVLRRSGWACYRGGGQAYHRPDPEPARRARGWRDQGMKIEDVEGIGATYATKLADAGVSSTDALLEGAAKPSGRKALEDATGISGKLILEWVNHVDLMRID